MQDQGSSWARAPPRDLGPKPREEANEWDGVYNAIPSFQPELVSAPELRQKARSSGYGKEVPRIQRVDLGPDDKRPWDQEPEPTFRPELPENELRKAARSSGYGKQLPPKKEVQPESPSFKPELRRSSSGKKMASSVSSSGYGKVAASPSRPSSAPTATFRPQMPKSRLRDSVKSSSYGTVPAQARPVTAPGRNAGSFDATPSKPKYVPRYSLLADRSDKEVYPEERQPVKEFVLDGLYTTTTRSRFEDSFGAGDFKPSPHQEYVCGMWQGELLPSSFAASSSKRRSRFPFLILGNCATPWRRAATPRLSRPRRLDPNPGSPKRASRLTVPAPC
jgi:hypothetical protein